MRHSLSWPSLLLVCGSFFVAFGLTQATAPLASANEGLAAQLAAAAKGQSASDSKFPKWEDVTKDAKKIEGLFPLYYNEKEQKLLMEISQGQYDKDLIMPISIARGAGWAFLGGDTLNFGNQWVISFRRAANNVLVIRRNVRYQAKKGSPQADAVEVSYNDSVIKALPIKSEQGGGSKVLVDLADLFMTDLAGMGINPDRSRSTWASVKAFPKNLEIQVSAVFQLGGFYGYYFGGDMGVPDPRGTQVVVHYGLSMLPENNGYKPRVADDRVGHFLSVVKDFSNDNDRTAFVRYVTRWNLEKADTSAEKSPPKEPIIFWIEKTVPREYRPYVKEGILEWNKAFEKIGFIDAIQVRDQQSEDQFDPEDMRYNTFRWIATSTPFAMGPSRTNPKTGQILDADILFDESFIRYWRQEYVLAAGLPESLELLRQGHHQAWFKLHAAELPWLVSAEPLVNKLLNLPREDRHGEQAPIGHHHGYAGPSHGLLGHGADHHRCQHGAGMQRQLGLMAAVMAAHGKIPPGGKVPEEFIGEALREVTMHEVGHTLGLRHNFKASTMLSLDEINNKEITSKKGMAGSVMDYLPANIAPKGTEQGHYFSPTIGPYDYWAIEYAYKPISGNETEELAKIASRVAEPDLVYGTDEDMWASPDPRLNTYDLGDPAEYAQQRVKLVKESIAELGERVVAEGEGWQRAREAFSMLLGELSSATYLSAQYVGAQYNHRDHRGDPDAREPLELVPLEKQRETIAFLQEEILSEKAFDFPPALLKRLAPEYWSHWGAYGSYSYQFPLNDQIGYIQRIVLSRFLNSSVLRAIQDIERHAEKPDEVLQLPEVFDTLTDAIWSELPAEGQEPEQKIDISTVRRNLQREHVKRLATMVLGPRSSTSFELFGDILFIGFQSPPPPDARALARMHLKQIQQRVGQVVDKEENEDGYVTAYSRAHLEELNDQIAKVLDASLQVNEP